jgi:tRNA pseudouridine32 synthase/23S rRNA pseudouridine746 synthase
MHCAHPDGLGCPILGDELYGHKSDRLYLQAQAITFIHPVTGKRMHFELKNEF